LMLLKSTVDRVISFDNSFHFYCCLVVFTPGFSLSGSPWPMYFKKTICHSNNLKVHTQRDWTEPC
jgi:hypothetical protein